MVWFQGTSGSGENSPNLRPSSSSRKSTVCRSFRNYGMSRSMSFSVPTFVPFTSSATTTVPLE